MSYKCPLSLSLFSIANIAVSTLSVTSYRGKWSSVNYHSSPHQMFKVLPQCKLADRDQLIDSATIASQKSVNLYKKNEHTHMNIFVGRVARLAARPALKSPEGNELAGGFVPHPRRYHNFSIQHWSHFAFDEDDLPINFDIHRIYYRGGLASLLGYYLIYTYIHNPVKTGHNDCVTMTASRTSYIVAS